MYIELSIQPEISLQASRQLKEKETELAEEMVVRHYATDPARWNGFGESGRKQFLQDVHNHINYLAEAMAVQDIPLFCEYAAWVKSLFIGLPLPEDTLIKTFQIMQEVILERLPVALAAAAAEFTHAALSYIPDVENAIPSFLKEDQPHYELARNYLDMILAAERQKACNLILNAANWGVSLQDIYLNIFQPCQREVGRLWQTRKITVAQEHYSTAITQTAMSLLYPRLFSTVKNGKRLVATSVSGDLHEIGIRMVADFFEMEGWHTTYLGANTPAQSIPIILIEQKAHVLALSVALVIHLNALVELIEIVRNTDECRRVKILVGGHPFNVSPSLWKRVGADGYAADAPSAVRVANQLVGNPE